MPAIGAGGPRPHPNNRYLATWRGEYNFGRRGIVSFAEDGCTKRQNFAFVGFGRPTTKVNGWHYANNGDATNGVGVLK
jgi:hypothetical protein